MSGAHNSPDPVVVNAALGVELGDELVVLALTHRSYAYENGGLPTNERLEFLGDSVLGVIITDSLYRTHPTLPEGRLAKLRASIVNMHALAGVGRGIGLGEQLRLGRGEELTGGRDKASIVADAVEAVIGAVYLEHGLETARDVVHRLFADLLDAAPAARRRTGLEDLAAGTVRLPQPRRARVPGDAKRVRTTQRCSPRRCCWAAPRAGRAPAAPRKRRSRTPPPPRTPPCRPTAPTACDSCGRC